MRALAERRISARLVSGDHPDTTEKEYGEARFAIAKASFALALAVFLSLLPQIGEQDRRGVDPVGAQLEIVRQQPRAIEREVAIDPDIGERPAGHAIHPDNPRNPC